MPGRPRANPSIHAFETDFRRRVRQGDAVDFFFRRQRRCGPRTARPESFSIRQSSGLRIRSVWALPDADGIVDYYDDTETTPSASEPSRIATIRPADVRLRHAVHRSSMSPRGTRLDCATPVAPRFWQPATYYRGAPEGGYGTTCGSGMPTATNDDAQCCGSPRNEARHQGQEGSHRQSRSTVSFRSHLHYEVLVNNRFVPFENPCSARAEPDRSSLAEFQKEPARI